MSTAQWILNLALLGWVLTRNLGTHRITGSTVLVPLTILVVATAWILRALPTAGHDIGLELVGAAAGVVLGLAATALIRTRPIEEHLVATAGAGFAAGWVAAIGGRMLFAQWATHGGARTIAEFSMRHQITGADAWTAGFVLMAVMMVAVQLAVTLVQLGLHRSDSATIASRVA